MVALDIFLLHGGRKIDVMAIVARKGCSCNYYHVGDSIERLCVVSAVHFRL